LKRVEAIQKIMALSNNTLVIASCGHISREVYATKDKPTTFYNYSMGSTLPIAIGLALNTKHNVSAIIGDGEALTSLGSLALMNNLKLPNLKLFILDNNCYGSTGRQLSCSNTTKFTSICDCVVIEVEPSSTEAQRIPLSPKQIKERFMNALAGM
jgi:sulfopyruvate decarboxylase subunit beta